MKFFSMMKTKLEFNFVQRFDFVVVDIFFEFEFELEKKDEDVKFFKED